MKRILLVIAISLGLLSCSKDFSLTPFDISGEWTVTEVKKWNLSFSKGADNFNPLFELGTTVAFSDMNSLVEIQSSNGTRFVGTYVLADDWQYYGPDMELSAESINFNFQQLGATEVFAVTLQYLSCSEGELSFQAESNDQLYEAKFSR